MQVHVRVEVRLVGVEVLGPAPVGLDVQPGIRGHEGVPLGLIRLEQLLLGALDHQAQPIQVVLATGFRRSLEIVAAIPIAIAATPSSAALGLSRFLD